MCIFRDPASERALEVLGRVAHVTVLAIEWWDYSEECFALIGSTFPRFSYVGSRARELSPGCPPACQAGRRDLAAGEEGRHSFVVWNGKGRVFAPDIPNFREDAPSGGF